MNLLKPFKKAVKGAEVVLTAPVTFTRNTVRVIKAREAAVDMFAILDAAAPVTPEAAGSSPVAPANPSNR
jgi:hypothetical protein